MMSAVLSRDSLFSLFLDVLHSDRPVLFELLQRRGDCSVFDYLGGQLRGYIPHSLYQERKKEIKEVIVEEVNNNIGLEASQGISYFLDKFHYILTSDHLGVLNHPFFASAHVIFSLISHKEDGRQEREPRWFLSLDSSSVSMNNSSYPRGFLFHGRDRDGILREYRIPLVPKKERMTTVFGALPFSQDRIEFARETVLKLRRSGKLDSLTSNFVLDVITQIFGRDDILSARSFSSQAIKAHYAAWNFVPFFNENKMVHLDLERVVAKVLIRYHIFSEHSPLYSLFFDDASRRKGFRIFQGITGSHVSSARGTVFFWLIKEGKRVPLSLEGDMLVSQKGDRFVLEPNTISTLLAQERLMPNLLIVFLVLAGFYGINCFGGFGQVDYLTVMMDRWRNFLSFIGREEESTVNLSVPTNSLFGDLGFFFLKDGGRFRWYPASEMDIMLYFREEEIERCLRYAKSISIQESLMLNFPELLHIIAKNRNRPVEYCDREVNVSQSEIVNLFSLEDKIFQLRG